MAGCKVSLFTPNRSYALYADSPNVHGWIYTDSAHLTLGFLLKIWKNIVMSSAVVVDAKLHGDFAG